MSSSETSRLGLAVAPFKLRGTSLPATFLQPWTSDLSILEQELQQRLEENSDLLKAAPLVLDLSEQSADFDLQGFCKVFRKLGIPLVAVRANDPVIQEKAGYLELLVLNTPICAGDALEEELVATPLVHQGAVRSGQQLVNAKGDLVVLGPVNQGAEVLASGHIYIYGALRGRALAGIHGDEQARVHCLQLSAELVAIAGCYQTEFSSPAKFGGVSRVQLVDSKLMVNPLTNEPKGRV